MNKKQVIAIAVLAFIPFLFHLFHPAMLGVDSVYFYLFSCGAENIPQIEIPLLSKLFFLALPCNLVLFKLVSSIILLASSLIVAKTGALFDKKRGWLAGVFVFWSLAWVNFHIQLEDDVIGYPFLFAAIYFWLKGEKEKNNAWRVASIALILFTGALLWKGALVYLLAFSFIWVFAYIILFVLLLFIGFGALDVVVWGGRAQENLNAFVFSLLGASSFGFGHGLGIAGMYVLRRKVWIALPFLAMMFLNIKWSVHLSPFLGLGLMFLFADIQDGMKRKNLRFDFEWANRNLEWVPIALTIFSLMALGANYLFLSIPYASQLEAVQFTVQEAGGSLIDNDWSYGYWIMFYGGRTDTFGGGWPDYTESYNEMILLTENPVINNDCRLLREWEKGGFYGADIRVYDCSRNR